MTTTTAVHTVPVNTVALTAAQRICAAALEYARTTYSGAVACAVVGAQGELVAYSAHDGTGSLPRRLAARKAYSAVMFKRDTAAVRGAVSEGKIDMPRLGDPDLIAIPGGVPILVDGHIVGAVGVSGLSPDDDAAVAHTAIGDQGSQ